VRLVSSTMHKTLGSRSSSIARADVSRGNRFTRSPAIRRCKPLRNVSAVRPKSCTDANSFRAAFRYLVLRTIAAWPGAGPSLWRPAALMGFVPFAGLLPQRVGDHL
jgi:hypothetical protein